MEYRRTLPENAPFDASGRVYGEVYQPHLYYVCAKSTGEYPFSVSRLRRISKLAAKQLTSTALKCNIEDEG